MSHIFKSSINEKFFIPSILCSSLVPFLVTGSFVPDLIISFLSIWFLYFSIKNKIYSIYKNYYFYLFILFCLVCIISSFLSDDILFSLKSSLFYFRIGVFSLLISYLINNNKNILDYFYFAFLITFAALIIDGSLQYFSGLNLFKYSLTGNRVSSFFGDELIMGSYLSRLFPLFLALHFVRKYKNYSELFLFYILTAMTSFLIVVSGERAALFFHILSLFFILTFISTCKNFFLSAIIFILLIIFVIFKYDVTLKKRYIDSTITSIGLTGKYEKKYIFTAGHDSIIKTGLNMFLDKPIFGQGPRMFRVKCKKPEYAAGISPCYPHPHNFYIQLLAETGIVGFSFLAGFFIYFIIFFGRYFINYYFHKERSLSNYQICLFAGLLITLWPFSSNGNFFTNKLMIFYSLQIGFFGKK